MESPIIIDDLRVPPFQETSISRGLVKVVLKNFTDSATPRFSLRGTQNKEDTHRKSYGTHAHRTDS
jgi:hypothetical protein